MTAQICAVNKTLMSVTKIASRGNRVVFDDDGSYIEDKETGELIPLHRRGSLYVMKLWVKDAGFARQG